MKQLKNFLLTLCLVMAGALWTDATAAVRYVRAGAYTGQTGLSWANANGDMQAMINASAPGDEV